MEVVFAEALGVGQEDVVTEGDAIDPMDIFQTHVLALPYSGKGGGEAVAFADLGEPVHLLGSWDNLRSTHCGLSPR